MHQTKKSPIKAQACDKKCKAPIIPKIKVCKQEQGWCNQQNYHKGCQKPSQPTKKIPNFQYPNNLSLASSYIGTVPKSFPKQQQLQKMTKKQLAQTYYEQFLRLHRENEILDKQLAFIRHQRDLLYKRYNDLKDQQRQSQTQRPKRQRRGADQIQRHFICPIKRCNRSYGSEGSLFQHIKIKHEEYYKSQQYQNFLNKRREEFPENY